MPSSGSARTPPPLVLASASPRRRDLLTRAGLAFEVLPVAIDESARPGEAPEALVERLASEKALAALALLEPGGGHAPARVVLGSDTVVVLGESILGKPRDAAHAVELLTRLIGRQHRVLTGVAVVASDGGHRVTRSVESRVRMREADQREIREYVAGGEPLDKAGAYALQGEGRRFVEGVEGSESNVIGLPLELTLPLLREAGIEIPSRIEIP